MRRTPNIGGRAVQRRLLLAPIGIAVAGAVYWLQTTLGLAHELRLLVFLPLLAAAYGFFQFREKT